MMDDGPAIARLIDAIRPWREKVVLVGGWAHRLYRLHPDAELPRYQPIVTRDADIAFDADKRMTGSIATALKAAGFEEALSSDHVPPVSHYHLGEEGDGFYVEFLTPLRGSAVRRDGSDNATVSAAGITAQKLRHLEVLLVAPWRLDMTSGTARPLAEQTLVLVANPVSFMAQKLLIHTLRHGKKKAQDILYLNDTLELFGARLDRLRHQWIEAVRPGLSERQVSQVTESVNSIFEAVSDPIRAAAQIARDRGLSPHEIQRRCSTGLAELFAP